MGDKDRMHSEMKCFIVYPVSILVALIREFSI